jgi:hypothetical protein
MSSIVGKAVTARVTTSVARASTPAGSPLRLAVNRRLTVLSLATIAFFLLVCFVATHLLFLAGYPEQMGMRRLFNLDGEGNLPAWFSGAMLLFAALLLLVIATDAQRRRDACRYHWWLMTIVLLLMSVDEVAGLHEMLNRPAMLLPFDNKGLLLHPWVALGALIVLVLALLLRPFFRQIDARFRHHLLIAGLVFFGGAIGVEMAGAWLVDFQGLDTGPDWSARNEFTVEYMFVVLLEEALEMTGAILLINGLLEKLQRVHGTCTLSLA